jgi:outer membrane murein-binding lipoprotein Lpp
MKKLLLIITLSILLGCESKAELTNQIKNQVDKINAQIDVVNDQNRSLFYCKAAMKELHGFGDHPKFFGTKGADFSVSDLKEEILRNDLLLTKYSLEYADLVNKNSKCKSDLQSYKIQKNTSEVMNEITTAFEKSLRK